MQLHIGSWVIPFMVFDKNVIEMMYGRAGNYLDLKLKIGGGYTGSLSCNSAGRALIWILLTDIGF